MTLLKKIG